MNIPDEHMPAIMLALLYVRNSSRDIRQLNTPARTAEIMEGNFAAINACARPLPEPEEKGFLGTVEWKGWKVDLVQSDEDD